jgi:hypothetical protein
MLLIYRLIRPLRAEIVAFGFFLAFEKQVLRFLRVGSLVAQ